MAVPDSLFSGKTVLKPSEKITDGSDGFDKDVTKKSPMYSPEKMMRLLSFIAT